MAKHRLVLGGRFKLIRHLGGGGMSEVFLAEQLSLGRAVALKVLKRDLGKLPAMAERFRREARLLSTVDHPSVVRVIDFESGKDGTVVVMEYAEGETLEGVLALGPFDARRAMRVLLQLAEGLAAIHDKGIVHRDIKPQNVAITPTTRGEQARLLDFGIARLMEISDEIAEDTKTPPLGNDPFVSSPGQAIGTPAYVAPEQAMAEPVDARTDVYAFGVLAYRVLSGTLPFEGPTAKEFLSQHVTELPPRLEEVAPHLKAHGELVRLVMRCLEKAPEARPADGQALVVALRECIPADALGITQTAKALAALTTSTWATMQQTASSVGRTSARTARFAASAASRLDPQMRNSLLITLAVAALVPVAWAVWPMSQLERAEQLLTRGDSAAALALIDAELPSAHGSLPQLLSLRAAALHQLGRFDEERALLLATPYQALHPAPPMLMEALADDFAAAESDDDLRELMAIVPTRLLEPAFVKLANGPVSMRQWGALRWLDVSDQARRVNLVARYSADLDSKACPVRAAAARRLGELDSVDAIAPLRELSETPKDEARDGPIECGQDEAAEAIRRLKKRR